MKNFISILFTLVFSLLINVPFSLANTSDSISSFDSENSLTESDIPEKSNKEFKKNTNQSDIFGDEQTFPFVAGLGKNAAH